jgi:cell division protein FtsW (lipid II flippase)
MWAWLLLGLALLAGTLYARQLWRKIAALVSYVLCLLFSDEFCGRERTRLKRWMETAEGRGNASLMILASGFVLHAAYALARKGPIAMAPAPARPSSRTAA